MNSILVAASLIFIVISSCGGSENASREKTIDRAQLKLLSARQYCVLILAASRKGHQYPLEARKSGLNRHYKETVLYFLSQGYEIRDDNEPRVRTLPARNDPSGRIWRHLLVDCFGK